VAGLAFIAAGLATLAAGAPDRLLVTTASGWEILSRRVSRLAAAVAANDVSLARRLARRGLGDTAPLDWRGNPVIHRVERPEMLAALLEQGLDPDAPDEDGRTRLMVVQQPELARILLAAGADVHARDRLGRSVADHHLSYGPIRPLLDAHAGGALSGSAEEAAVVGRTDWLSVEGDAAAAPGLSSATLEPPSPDPGEEATVTATLVNASDEDRQLDVRAVLNEALLFVSATHDGAIARPGQPQAVQTVRWPLLALPAHGRGQIALRVVRRGDAEAGDPAVQWYVRPERGGETETLLVSPPTGARETAGGGLDRTWPQRLWFLPFLLLPFLLWGWSRRVRRQGGDGVQMAGRVVAMGGAAVCAAIAVALVWSAIEPLVRFDTATCTILDRRVFSREIVTRSTRPVSSTATRSYGVPLAAVRIETGGRPVVAAGFSVGMATHSVEALRPFALGARVPCWVDPAEPSRFTLVRRPPISMAAGLGLLAVTLLMLTAVLSWLSPGTPR
jgi:hypothetical protein